MNRLGRGGGLFLGRGEVSHGFQGERKGISHRQQNIKELTVN